MVGWVELTRRIASAHIRYQAAQCADPSYRFMVHFGDLVEEGGTVNEGRLFRVVPNQEGKMKVYENQKGAFTKIRSSTGELTMNSVRIHLSGRKVP